MTDRKPDDTEDKDPWLEYGEKKEKDFVKEVAPEIGIDARINPEKQKDPAAVDLIVGGTPTDLKTQETPFFTAERKYGIPPKYCVTFNVNDSERYRDRHPELDIIFWVRWIKETRWNDITVEKMEGVWRVSFSRVQDWIDTGKLDIHQYRRRLDDTVNSKKSYALDLRDMECLCCLRGSCTP